MNVLFIGFGSIAKKHHAALLDLYPDVKCFALRSQANAAAVPDLVNLYNWSELPSSIDFAIVSSPTYKHTADVKELIDRRIPIFLEKPISHRLDGLDELNEQIKKNTIPTYIACNLRFLPVLQFLREEILKSNKRINEVVIYAGSFLPEWRPNINFRQNYSANESMGGGVHVDLFHELDYACWIFGKPEQSFNIKRSSSTLKIPAVDFASYSLIYPNFVTTVLLNYFRKQAKRTIEIVFDNDVWTVDLLKNKLVNAEGEIIFEKNDFTIRDTYKVQMHYFTDAIKKGVSPDLNTFENSLEILKICLRNDATKR
ncbi:MAG: Gfo/Idh/MocA family oxidoreductase [bacterium]|nr:Gfo/Idh/MocA family oxidoreductase [bacterium]